MINTKIFSILAGLLFITAGCSLGIPETRDGGDWDHSINANEPGPGDPGDDTPGDPGTPPGDDDDTSVGDNGPGQSDSKGGGKSKGKGADKGSKGKGHTK